MEPTTRIHNFSEETWAWSRRKLLKRMAGGLGWAAVASPLVRAARPVPGAGDAAGESYWNLVKSQFPLKPGVSVMNAANLCPSPYPVQAMVLELTRDMDGDASSNNRRKFLDLRESSRRALADLLGAVPEEIAIVRNTSEGNNVVVNGLDLGPGDEVVLWEQNHPTNNVAWDMRSRRHGFTVKRVSTPASVTSQDDLIRPFREALTAKTRVLSMTHASNISGVMLPVAELCRLARERVILTLIDGAQSFGSLRVNLHAIGCDFYTGSAHKWLMGPKEAGVLYVRRKRVAQLWPLIVGSGWSEDSQQDARKFESLGQRDDPTLAAVGQAVRFHQSIGVDRVEARVRELAAALKTKLESISGVRLKTPREPEFSAGVVIFSIAGVTPAAASSYLYSKHRIGGASLEGKFSGVRLCPNIYNTMEEIDRAVAAVKQLASNGIAG